MEFDAPIRTVSATRLSAGGRQESPESVVVEEPLEIRLNGRSLAVTMRTPGDDEALAAGFLLTEGIIRHRNDLWDLTRCADPASPHSLNVVEAVIPPDLVPEELASGRQRYSSSACGLCGRATIESVRALAPALPANVAVTRAVIQSLPDRMRRAQTVFERTGGLHAAALFTVDGTLQFLAEDIGRHNAVDKAAGLALLAETDLSGSVLLVSGRAGFEIVQKALVARIPIICAISAPSSLAVELACESGQILAAFVRGDSLNIYAGQERVMEAAGRGAEDRA